MNRSTRLSIGIALVLALSACATPGSAPSSAPSEPAPSAPASPAPAADAPSPTPATPAAPSFESQDGAVRFALPDGWTVEDRSALGEASEMYGRGPGWLNDLVVLDEHGDRMLWYREDYGDDSVDCGGVREWPLEIPVDPYAPDLVSRLEAEGASPRPVLIIGDAGEASRWSAEASAGAGAAQLGLRARFAPQDAQCDNLDESIPVGERVVRVDVVADSTATAQPDTLLAFSDADAARAWLDSAEAATLVDVLSSIELTGAPVLDHAP